MKKSRARTGRLLAPQNLEVETQPLNTEVKAPPPFLLASPSLAESPRGPLLFQAEVDALASNIRTPEWLSNAIASFTETILDPTFPCFFAAVAHKKGNLVYGFADAIGEPSQRWLVHETLCAYLSFVTKLSAKQALMTPLIFFIKPDPSFNIKDYADYAWQLIQFFGDHDPSVWPLKIPTDPENPEFTMCFQGVEIFINVSTPAHRLRRSRNLGSALVLVIQPRDGFDALVGKERPHIRARIDSYDEVPSDPSLGTYGHEGSLEWVQYVLYDQPSDRPARCPFHKENPGHE